ncbi:ABC transporter permease [Paraburkholderia sp. BCC1886]|uniref:ABC transporter permease n=1 Tax=Paraburkholderia sp. BCC1886 TaxID=2562670 RepID=UPI001183FA4A|nr:ABC transporter permease [Paraburkholderia sp. BCC1886]
MSTAGTRAAPTPPAPATRAAASATETSRFVALTATFPRIFRSSIAIVIFCGLWESLPRAGWVDATFLPPFSAVLAALFDMLRSGELEQHLLASTTRALGGFVIAVALGVPLGLVIGWYRKLEEVLNPLLELFRNTAPLALLPVFVLILGMGETSKISMVVYSCIWPVVLNTVSGVRNVDPLLIRSARSMGLGSLQLFIRVVLPASVPTVFTGIRVAAAYSILVLIAAEMVGAKAGLGYLVNYSQFTFEIPKMYAGIITLALLGLAFNHAVLLAERRLTAWRG